MTDAVVLTGVAKSFGPRRVVDDVSLTVETGALLGFVGPNGAGKSTLLRMLVGIVFRDAGDLRVLGVDPSRDALSIRRRCCYLPGETSVYGNMRGDEFLTFSTSFFGAVDPRWVQRMQSVYELPLRRKVRTYSAGMKQKLALIATLAPDVDLYLLDEPDRALDATARLQLRELLRELHARGKTILLSSHHLTEIEALAQRQVFVLGGRRVPDAVVADARARLRRRMRVRLRDGVAAPPEFTHATRDPDGAFSLQVDGEPLELLRRLTPTDVVSAEVGTAPLEDLYRTLLSLQAEAP